MYFDYNEDTEHIESLNVRYLPRKLDTFELIILSAEFEEPYVYEDGVVESFLYCPVRDLLESLAMDADRLDRLIRVVLQEVNGKDTLYGSVTQLWFMKDVMNQAGIELDIIEGEHSHI